MAKNNFSAAIKTELDRIVKENFNPEEQFTIESEKAKAIQDCLRTMKKQTKMLRTDKEANDHAIGNMYSPNIGVDTRKLDYIINLNLKNKQKIEKRVKILYEQLNLLSSLIKNEEETSYIFYYFDKDTGIYQRKVIQPADVTKFYSFSNRITSKGKIEAELKSSESAIDKLFKETTINEEFSRHVANYMKVLADAYQKEKGVEMPAGSMGYAYESFEYHVQHYGDKIITDEKGNIEYFKSHGDKFNSKSVLKGFFKQKGQARWITGGDVGSYQLKSSATFSVSSLQQIEISFNTLYNLLNGKTSLSIIDIEKLVLFLNDFHEDVADKTDEEISQLLLDTLNNTIKSLTK